MRDNMLSKKIAREIEIAIDDDEGLTSLSFSWDGAGGYFLITNDPESERIYCEFADQSNGIYIDKIIYDIDEVVNEIKFSLAEGGSFERTKIPSELKIVIPEKTDVNCIKKAMGIISTTPFGGLNANKGNI